MGVSMEKTQKKNKKKKNMKGPEGICGATCALLYTFYYPRRSKKERKKLKEFLFDPLHNNNPKFISIR
jgi:hypothetical protein